ncbi:hypothetical protein BD289DRAFT_449183 [Coniella lustricola]|uniref:Uncharacterized protein n=1 Tax=Coniella lustricola TaxID=2025994 RepID=A0A2T3ANZ0_9PEZI|nr:hypothetical protein BD289DRAFT_449183 [Coniella lustricola]
MTGQPSNIEAYIQPNNPVTRDPLEEKAAQQPHRQVPQGGAEGTAPARYTASADSQGGVPTSRGLGVRGGEPVDAQEAAATSRGTDDAQPQNPNVDAEQLATLAEGKVAHAVERKSGTQQAPGAGPAEAPDFASDLDRKKAEQAEAREQIKSARQGGADLGDGAGRLGNESLADA